MFSRCIGPWTPWMCAEGAHGLRVGRKLATLPPLLDTREKTGSPTADAALIQGIGDSIRRRKLGDFLFPMTLHGA